MKSKQSLQIAIGLVWLVIMSLIIYTAANVVQGVEFLKVPLEAVVSLVGFIVGYLLRPAVILRWLIKTLKKIQEEEESTDRL